VGPESINGTSVVSVGAEQPGTEDWLGQDIENSVGNDLGINRPETSSITNGPDDWVQGPDDQGETSNGSEGLCGLAILGSDSSATWNGQLVDDDQESKAGEGVVTPLLSVIASESSKEAESNHEDISDDGNNNVGTVQSSEEGKIQKKEWGSDSPVGITSPEDLTVDVVLDIWGVLVLVVNANVSKGVSITGGHGEVGDGSKDGDEGGQDMEKSLGNWGLICSDCKDQGRDGHDNSDEP